MRVGGLISDFLGEVRLAGAEVYAADFLGSSRLVTWQAPSAGAPVAFQVYASGAFAGACRSSLAMLQLAPGNMAFEILAIAAHLAGHSQANVLESAAGRRVRLEWPASSSDDVAAYRVYGDGQTGAVNYGVALAEVNAEPAGHALASYAWSSEPLVGGAWRFGVRAVDAAGNEADAPLETSVTLTPAPDPPTGLTLSYNPGARTATLAWTAPARWT